MSSSDLCRLKYTNELKKHNRNLRIKSIKKNWELYFFLAPAIIAIILFNYVPMYGVQIAFKDFNAFDGILGSPWIGFENFKRFFDSYYFWSLIENTVSISFYQLILGFIIPIILTLMLSQADSKGFKKLVQNVIYAPHFISVVVIVGMLSIFLSPTSGILNNLLQSFGFESVNFMAEPEYFRHLYVWSGIWQSSGWGTVIYLAAISNINPELYEAAIVDGATKFQKMIHIDIPSILPTMIMVLILNTGTIMNVGYEKVYLMQNSVNLPVSEVISTFVYKSGIINTDYSFSSAVGLFNSAVNCIMLVVVNNFARRVSDTSLW